LELKTSIVIGTFSGSAVIKLIFENPDFSRNYLFEMMKFKGITREEKCCKKVFIMVEFGI
jgi:hypothetical protein